MREGPVEPNRWLASADLLLSRLNLGLVMYRQRESEDGAVRPIRICPQSPAVRVDNGAAYRESNPHSAILGRVEGIEDALTILCGDTRPRILDAQDQLVVPSTRG